MREKMVTVESSSPGALESGPISVRHKLSALWVTLMFIYVYVDIFSFYEPGTIEEILAGQVWEFAITQGWALGALACMTVPSLMVFLSLVLPVRVARWTNIAAASVFVLVSIGNAIGESWSFYWFGAAAETALLLLVVRYSWAWPRVSG